MPNISLKPKTYKPLVSIVTPTYNHEKYIGQCIESVLGQTYQNWEMIIVDDGSTDQTAEIVKRYQDPRIKYFYQKNKGAFRIGETYSKAFEKSNGELIAILEGDDWWPLYKLERMVPFFKNPKVILTHGNSEWVFFPESKKELRIFKRPILNFNKSVLENRPTGEALKSFLRLELFIVSATVIIRRSALEKIGGFRQEPYLPMVDFTTYLNLMLIGEFAYSDKVMGFWRKHSSSITLTLTRRIIEGLGRAASTFIKNNETKIKEIGIDPKKYISKLEIITKNKLRNTLKDSSFWAELQLIRSSDFKTARKLCLNYWSFIRTPKQLVLGSLIFVSIFFRINLASCSRNFFRLLKNFLSFRKKHS